MGQCYGLCSVDHWDGQKNKKPCVNTVMDTNRIVLYFKNIVKHSKNRYDFVMVQSMIVM